MKKLIETTEEEGLESLIGSEVLLFCLNYIYHGTLSGVGESCVQLSNPSIVYETGDFSSKSYKDKQRLHTDVWYVQRSVIESFGAAK